jgi:hypothetical protein
MGVLWPSFEGCPFTEAVSYYGGSLAVRLSTCRRSRVCSEETMSACRSPFVPYQAHCLSLAEESFYPKRDHLGVFQRRHAETCCGGCGRHRTELGFDNFSLTMRTGLAGRSRTCLPQIPALAACSCPLWLSPPGQPLSWRSLCSQPPLPLVRISSAPTRRTSRVHMARLARASLQIVMI